MRAKLDDKQLIYSEAGINQCVFVRNNIGYMMGAGLTSRDAITDMCRVIGTHRSKSVILPVYQISRPDVGLVVTLRNNFYNWKVSFQSEQRILVDFDGLFATPPPIDPEYTGNPLSSVYFEGFKPEHIFGYYMNSDRRQFSAEIRDDYRLWTTLFLVMRHLGAIQPFKWGKRPETTV
jgi:hypothetical protein